MDISLYTRSPQNKREEVSNPAATNINTVQSWRQSPVLVWRPMLGLSRYIVTFWCMQPY